MNSDPSRIDAEGFTDDCSGHPLPPPPASPEPNVSPKQPRGSGRFVFAGATHRTGLRRALLPALLATLACLALGGVYSARFLVRVTADPIENDAEEAVDAFIEQPVIVERLPRALRRSEGMPEPDDKSFGTQRRRTRRSPWIGRARPSPDDPDPDPDPDEDAGTDTDVSSPRSKP